MIFKCVNSTVGPNFKAKFAEFCTCKSLEQCTGPREKTPNVDVPCFQCNPNETLGFVWIPLIVEK